jgi:hypothetical protein
MGKAKIVEGGGLKNSMAPKESDEPQEYEIEDGVKTLERAEAIKANKKLMPHIHKHIGKKISSLKDLRRLASEKANEESGESKAVEAKELKGNIEPEA